MASRVFPVTFAGQLSFSVVGAGDPAGAGNYFDAIRAVDDGRYVRYNPATAPGAVAATAWAVADDGAIPPASTITDVEVRQRYAGSTSDPFFTKVWLVVPGVEAAAALPAPVVKADEPPQSAAWVTEAVKFAPADIPGPFDLAKFVAGRYAFEFSLGPDALDLGFLDFVELVLHFSLAPPSNVSSPTFTGINMVSARAAATVNIPAGAANAQYPLSARFEYTDLDPTSKGFSDIDRVSMTDPEELVNTAPEARVETFTQIISGLTPGTRVSARAVVQTADSQKVWGDWGTFTTRQFDAVTTY